MSDRLLRYASQLGHQENFI